jgi:hypothetical protein
MSKVSPSALSRIELAFQGEVFGLAMYAAMAEAQTDPVRRWKWQVLTQLETETKAHMAGLLQRLGGNTVEQEQSRQDGIREARAIIGLPWPEMIKAFMADLPGLIDDYADLERQAALAGEDAAVLSRLTRHEVVTLEFCERELAGCGAHSADPVLAMLEAPPAPRVRPSAPAET